MFQEECLQNIKKIQTDFNSKFSSTFEFDVNWEFLDDSSFKSKDENQRKTIILLLSKILQKGLIEQSNSYFNWNLNF
jgi:hypothetical protein